MELICGYRSGRLGVVVAYINIGSCLKVNLTSAYIRCSDESCKIRNINADYNGIVIVTVAACEHDRHERILSGVGCVVFNSFIRCTDA